MSHTYFVDIDNLDKDDFEVFVERYDNIVIFTRHKTDAIRLPAYCLNKNISVISTTGPSQTFLFGVIEGLELSAAKFKFIKQSLPKIVQSQFELPTYVVVTNRPDKYLQMNRFNLADLDIDSSSEDDSSSDEEIST